VQARQGKARTLEQTESWELALVYLQLCSALLFAHFTTTTRSAPFHLLHLAATKASILKKGVSSRGIL